MLRMIVIPNAIGQAFWPGIFKTPREIISQTTGTIAIKNNTKLFIYPS
jgi:hypothetical protein